MRYVRSEWVKSGTILLVTLWMLAILSLLAIGIGFRSSIELKLTTYQTDSLKAYEIAKAGIVKAMNELEHDSTPEDTLWQCGITLAPDETLEGKFMDIPVGEGRFQVVIDDIQSGININKAGKDVLKSLVASDVIADNIRAWRGDTEGINPYNTDYADKPYACKKAPFNITNELLLVKDMTGELFYGGEDSAGVKDIITVYGPDTFKVNVNTADQKTLEVLLASVGLDKAMADSIVRYRKGNDGELVPSEDNNPCNENIQQFLKDAIPSYGGGTGEAPELSELCKLLTFQSAYFKITSKGIIEKGAIGDRRRALTRTITCIVKKESANPPSKGIGIIGWFE